MLEFLKTKLGLIDKTGTAPDGGTQFVSLAPTDQADADGVYSNALQWGTGQDDILNIALTGPYGSGKSSIIKSFLKRYRHKALLISLAAFTPGENAAKSDVSRQEIERSILQQMLYGADANRLPLSRFKRIQSPGKLSFLWSLVIAVGLFATWHTGTKFPEMVSATYVWPISFAVGVDLVAAIVAALFVWAVVHHLYVASFGVSLKSISLKDIEIAPEAINEESILNRHLDEIVYFFQRTSYELVVIEDLDRFENTDIFVTLREINSIINSNAGVKRKVRFLYALRDDMFKSTDRTKFFEFIVPVIPIINSSNSIDKMLKQGERFALGDKLDPQFLREVSRYLDDLRLIQNIFNEYAIYVANLDAALDTNKLLAILIYKNVFPSDFEDLHRGKGNLSAVFGQKAELITKTEKAVRDQIVKLEERLELAERQFPTNLSDLRRIYAMSVIEKLPASTYMLSVDRANYQSISELTNPDFLQRVIDVGQVYYASQQMGSGQRVSLAGLEAAIDPSQTYLQRVEEIQQKSAASKSATQKNIRELEERLVLQRRSQLKELARQNPEALANEFTAFGDQSDLARFLVLEGFLDDSYYQYTSLFHEGRLSPSDNKFLIQIRAFLTPEPDFQIDNPKEVIAAMRDDDFGQSYVLNVKIVDRLLADQSSYQSQRKKLLDFLATNFQECESFLAAYYAQGTEVTALVSALAKQCADFVPIILSSKSGTAHVAHILAYLSKTELVRLAKIHPELPVFLSANLADVLALELSFELERLEQIQVELSDLSSIAAYPQVARYLFEKGLYQVSVANLDFIFKFVLGVDDTQALQTGHYSAVQSANNPALETKINREFGDYLSNVLLKLQGNTEERVDAIRSIINREDQEVEVLTSFLAMQSAQLPTLADVPQSMHSVVFSLKRVVASWDNCLEAVLKLHNMLAGRSPV